MGTELNKMLEDRENLFEQLGIHKEWFNGKSVLDVGCGSGDKTICYNKWGAEVYGLDSSREQIELAKKNGEINDVKINFIPLSFWNYTPPIKFDFIACEEILEYTYAPSNGLARVSRWLNDGGYLFLSLTHKQEGVIAKIRSMLNNQVNKLPLSLASKDLKEIFKDSGLELLNCKAPAKVGKDIMNSDLDSTLNWDYKTRYLLKKQNKQLCE